ncbi:transcriptional regulator [Micromonospora endophytica]|uniref:Transcriptional regulator n=1 Tax=Micromonospora endophytica TaxID=515350 RepID=A0A2W2CIA8_9ACTN|nr:response regulator transcription factor [Micromonospora endophytica]PZF91458.1 transcriptional regulator [Micromonospora endophytica]RIW44339.1 DNA-binding response regulator [Micromonospora endophytica]BCJ62467.1 DNA-binding response regulator [Micromonospora endophytica]
MNNLVETTTGDGRFVLLVVDDDESVGAALVTQLAAHRVRGHHYPHAAEALLAAGALRPDAAVVAAGLTTMNSSELVRLLARRAGIPTVVGVGDDDGGAAAAGLRAGATAGVRRPYRAEEVLPILRGIRPETAGTLDPPIELGGLWADPSTFEVRLHGRTVALPLKEFRLLYFFMGHAERIITREQLLAAVWGATADDTSNTLTVHIKRLRRRLALDGKQPPMIVTVRGLGYRFVPATRSAEQDEDRGTDERTEQRARDHLTRGVGTQPDP